MMPSQTSSNGTFNHLKSFQNDGVKAGLEEGEVSESDTMGNMSSQQTDKEIARISNQVVPKQQ